MKAIFVFALALATAAGDLFAQEAPVRRPSRFDLGVYAGGSWTSDWLEVKDVGFGIGYNPIFGGFGTAWAQPRFGVRLHGAYIPSELPQADEEFQAVPDGRLLNVWLYDLDLMYRPFVERTDAPYWLSSVYLFAGGGGLTANVAGESSPEPTNPRRDCVYPYTLSDACLSYDPSYATVGQGTLGAGVNLFPLTNRIGLFGELGLHVYDSPFHLFGNPARGDEECDVDCVGEDLLAFTPRLVAGVKLATGGTPPAPVPPLLPPPPPPAVPVEEAVRVCVLVDDVPRYVDAVYLPATGDTVVSVAGMQRPFSEAYPAQGYAADQLFFINNEPVPFAGRRYVRYGLPRVVQPEEITRIGDYQGIGVFVETGAPTPPPILYLPARPACEYQPYQLEEEVRRVRG